MFHVIATCKTMPLTRHLDRSETEWRDLTTIICLQIIVSPVKDLYKQYNIYITPMKLS